jgi:hypothetical protein
MFAAEKLVRAIASAGGVLSLHGDKVRYRLPAPVAHLADELREYKPEVMSLLRSVGGRVAYFPACPKCGGYWLHLDERGLFTCQHCGLNGIEEHDARIASFLIESRTAAKVM